MGDEMGEKDKLKKKPLLKIRKYLGVVAVLFL